MAQVGGKTLHIISQQALRDFWTIHPGAQPSLSNWYRVVRQTDFESFQDIRNVFPSAEWLDGRVIFNIGGNNYRLIAVVHFNTKKLVVREVLTHADYSKGG